MATEEQVDRLIQDPRELLEILGQVAVSYSQRAFKLQRFGTIAWPARYPSQTGPTLNIAGALRDFSQGKTQPLSRRFQNRPTLIDSKLLSKSVEVQTISPDGNDPSVEIGIGGSAADYGSEQNFGELTSQPITDTAKTSIAKFIGGDAGAIYADKLGPLLNQDTLTTQLNERTFIGVNKELERLLAATVEEEAERI